MNLEQSIAAICVEHDIRTISINFTPTNAREHVVLAYVHDCDGRCESGYAADAGTAITNALALLRPEPVVVSDEPIILEEAS